MRVACAVEGALPGPAEAEPQAASRSAPASPTRFRKGTSAGNRFPSRSAPPRLLRAKGIAVKKFFNWVLVLAGFVGAFYCVGLIVPRSQTSGSKSNLVATPAQIYPWIADVTSWPQWHPDVLSVQERPNKKDRPVWRVTEKSGTTFELEVVDTEEDKAWTGTYSIDTTRYTLRFDLGWYGQGGRLHITRTVDTSDTWERAKGFLWSRDETGAVGLLNALAEQVGEKPEVKED